MRNLSKIITLFFVLLAFCQCSSDNESEQTEISNCNLTIPSGSLITLYTPKLQLVTTLEIKNDISVSGLKTRYINTGKIYYSFQGLNLVFGDHVVMNKIDISIDNNKITWLHSPDAKCAFFGEEYILHLDDTTTIDFVMGDKVNYQFAYSTDNYNISLNGSFIIN